MSHQAIAQTIRKTLSFFKKLIVNIGAIWYNTINTTLFITIFLINLTTAKMKTGERNELISNETHKKKLPKIYRLFQIIRLTMSRLLLNFFYLELARQPKKYSYFTRYLEGQGF